MKLGPTRPTDRAVRAGGWRLASGGMVERERPFGFAFDGKTFGGFAGDTLASALLANGVRLLGRSFKYHRPRGILSAGPEEPSALVELRTGARREPSTRATIAELYDGLEATSQNRWPSLGFDLLAVNGLVAPLLSAGFYYKTFMWPASFWEKVYEPMIRRAAGLGRAAKETDPDGYEKAFAHCDVLVVGAGPAGLAAALTAGRAGARVLLAEQDFALGGRLLAERLEIEGRPAMDWVRSAVAELGAMPGVRLMPRTTVFGVYDGGTYGALERVADHVPVPPAHLPRQRLWRIQARRAVLASGSIERPLLFGDNDRPGVMLAGAVRTYLNRFAVAAGERIVVATVSDDGWRTARDAADAGLSIEAVVDGRGTIPAAFTDLAQTLRRAGTLLVPGGRIVGVHGARGVHRVDVADADGRRKSIPCDILAVAGGWQPALALTCHLGGKPVWSEPHRAFLPGPVLPPGLMVAGAAGGALSLARCLATGAQTGAKAAEETGHTRRVATIPVADDEPSGVGPAPSPEGTRGKTFVDHQNDVTATDVALAAREGYSSIELMKRYTTSGMATDQGKTADVNAALLLADALGVSVEAVGTTVYRPPYTPVAIGALAGPHRGKAFRPTRLTPAHEFAGSQGGVMRESGPWLRAGWFPRAGEDWLEATIREVTATRTSVGFCDVSTLGKIDVQGPDAATFLDRLYTNMMSTLPIGKARYGLMLREDGFVMDDGTVARLGPEHFLVTTTTANAGSVLQHLEFCHQGLWPGLDVQMISVTDQWAQFSLAGPSARDVLARLVDRRHDLTDAAFPHLAARAITMADGVPARLFRLSYSGERAYEIAVPARYGNAFAHAALEAGRDHGITPYGLEALSVMRIEKGHVAGNEINGTTTARDLGLERMLSSKKDFIGRVLATRPALMAPDRWDLVGLKPVDPEVRLGAGAHLIDLGKEARTENDLGYVTSTAFSPTLGHWIALALLTRGRERHGERLRAVDLLRDRDTPVDVCEPVFIDPKGVRMHG